MSNLKYGTNEVIYKTETDLQTQKTDIQLPSGSREDEGWIGHLELVDANYYIQNGNSKVPLYSIGNCIQSPGINHNGKGRKKETNFPRENYQGMSMQKATKPG